MKFKRAINHDINISPTANGGFIANVGCAQLCFSDNESLLLALAEFLKDPKRCEVEYNQSGAMMGQPAEAIESQDGARTEVPMAPLGR